MSDLTVCTQRVSPELEAACDVLVWSALVMVGQRITRTPACPRPERAMARNIPYDRIHTQYPVDRDDVDRWKLMAGAWDHAPSVAERCGVDTFLLTAALDEYVRGLIAARMPHTFEMVQLMLRRISWAGTVVGVA